MENITTNSTAPARGPPSAEQKIFQRKAVAVPLDGALQCRNGPEAEPQIYPPLNFPEFLYLCYGMSLSVLALWHALKTNKAVELPLRSTYRGWHVFPRKKKNSYTKFLHRNRNILIPSYVYPTGTVMGENIPVDIQVGRNYKNFQLKRQFPSCSIISLLLLKKDTHSFGMSRIWKQLWFFFFFFFNGKYCDANWLF